MVRPRSSSSEERLASAPSSPKARPIERRPSNPSHAGADAGGGGGGVRRESSRDDLFVGPPSHFKSMPEPTIERSTRLEVGIALVCGLFVVLLTLWCAGGRARYAVSALWLVQIGRMHVQVWWLGGWKGFAHLCRRFPHAWVWTVTTLVPFTAIKFAQWLVVQLLFDSVGRVFRVDGDGVTMVRWWRMAIDLNKPLSVSHAHAPRPHGGSHGHAHGHAEHAHHGSPDGSVSKPRDSRSSGGRPGLGGLRLPAVGGGGGSGSALPLVGGGGGSGGGGKRVPVVDPEQPRATAPAPAPPPAPPRRRLGRPAALMTNIISPTLACNVQCLGYWATFNLLRCMATEAHVTMRNDLLGTSPTYNHHLTGVVDSGVMYWNLAAAPLLPPFTWLQTRLWDVYCSSLPATLDEAEERAKHWPTFTHLGDERFWSDLDPPSVDSLWFPDLLVHTERKLAV